MSTGVELIPLALAWNVIFGAGQKIQEHNRQARIQDWMDQMQLKFPTVFTNSTQLVQAVKLAGFDAVKQSGAIKTQFGDAVCSWERINGHWTAVFSKATGKDAIVDFMKTLTGSFEGQFFIADKETHRIQPVPTRTFPTNFRDGDLLLATLEKAGASPKKEPNGDITCAVGKATMRFTATEGAAYHLQVETADDMSGIFDEMAKLDQQYKRQVQQSTYEQLKQRIKDKGLTLETEEVLEDHTIVLTLNVSG